MIRVADRYMIRTAERYGIRVADSRQLTNLAGREGHERVDRLSLYQQTLAQYRTTVGPYNQHQHLRAVVS